jgi:hypothetical protein
MFEVNEDDPNQQAFAKLGKKLVDGQPLTEQEKSEMDRLAELIGIYDDEKAQRGCGYFCNSGWSCNPSSPHCTPCTYRCWR